MTEEAKTETKDQPKNSKWCLWTCGGCGLLIIIIAVILIVLYEATGFNLGRVLTGENGSTKKDAEDIEMSKAELVDYFVTETTFYSGVDRRIKLMKWEKPVITVSIEDASPEGGTKALDDFVTVFNSNSTNTKMDRVESGGDIKIYFQEDTKGSAGRSGPSSGADFTIDHADIKLDQKVAIFDQSLASILSHEIFHALGFTGHYNGEECRLMSPSTCGSRLAVNEESLIQMMYGTDIPAESDENQIRAFFQNWNPK